MTIELIVFIASILFGILLYWRESNGNGLYRFVNRIVNSKELQMKPDDKTGFVYKQRFLLRLVYITFLFLIISLVLQFLTPFKPFGSYNGISTFASSIVGTLLGTYLANFVLRSGKVIDEKSDDLGDLVSDTIEKGKEIIEDMTTKDEVVDNTADNIQEQTEAETPKQEKKRPRALKR